MTEQVKQKLKYWLLGIFTGGAVAAPITAFISKNVYEKKMAQAVDEAETRGMTEMAKYAVQQQKDSIEGEIITERDENGKPIAGRYPWGKDNKTLTEEDYGVKDEEDPRNYDVTIDEEGDDVTSEAHERYLDMINKYSGDDVIAPYIIDGDKFINEQYMEKSYVNWYEEDDVFEEDLDKVDDPFMTFGVTSGKELFKNAELRPEADIVYVRDERNTTDYEISRIHGSYAEMVGGEKSLGETDT